jgi:FkbM family methyltransferase
MDYQPIGSKKSNAKVVSIVIGLTALLILGITFYKANSSTELSEMPVMQPYATSHFRTAIETQNYFCERLFPFLRDAVLHPNSTVPLKLIKTKSFGKPFHMFIHSHHDTVSATLAETGIWESAQSKNILHALTLHQHKYGLLPHQVTLFDIGANVGWFSILVATHGFRSVAIEPSPSNELAIRLSLCANDLSQKIILLSKGVSDRERMCDLVSAGMMVGNTKTNCQDLRNPAKSGKFGKVKKPKPPRQAVDPTLKATPQNWRFKHHGSVHLVTLDSVIEEFMTGYGSTRDIAVIKLDAEGHESNIVDGARNALLLGHAGTKDLGAKIVSEYSPWMFGGPEQGQAFLKKFTDVGYHVRVGLKGWEEDESYPIVSDKLIKTIGENVVNVYLSRPVVSVDVVTDETAEAETRLDEDLQGISTQPVDFTKVQDDSDDVLTETAEIVTKPIDLPVEFEQGRNLNLNQYFFMFLI